MYYRVTITCYKDEHIKHEVKTVVTSNIIQLRALLKRSKYILRHGYSKITLRYMDELGKKHAVTEYPSFHKSKKENNYVSR